MNREAFDQPSKTPDIVLIGTDDAESIRMLGLSAALARISEHGSEILTIPDMNKGDFVNPIPINPPKESLTAADAIQNYSAEFPLTRTTMDDAINKAAELWPTNNRKQRRRMDRGQGRTAKFKRSEYAAFNENKAAEAEKERKKKKQTAKMKKKARR